MKSFPTYLLATLAILSCCTFAGAQQRVHIAGLENNPEYRTLLVEEEKLTAISDSMNRSMNNIRQSFRTDSENRSLLAASILQMEEETFDIRNRMAQITGQINAIEQSWIRLNLEKGEKGEKGEEGQEGQNISDAALREESPEKEIANLVYNSYFDRNLQSEELLDLRKAQQEEPLIPPLVVQYRDNNQRLQTLKHTYSLALVAESAESIKMRYDSLTNVNIDIDNRINSVWGTIFDIKSYVYNLLMDKSNRNDLLERFGNDMEGQRNQQTEWRGVYASDAIVAYFIQKRLITDYEILLARELGYEKCLDSLQKVKSKLSQIGEPKDLEPVVLKERQFLNFSDITIYPSSQYGAHNPIPEVETYPKGVIYRVLLGTYTSPQSPSVFRNVAPIAVQKSGDKKYRYFAGGFPNDTTANTAVEEMRKRGFKKPEPVVWMDGIYINPSGENTSQESFYRIELSGVDELSPEVKEVIRSVTGGKEILRGGDRFIVGPVDNAAEAIRLRLALEGRDSEMGIKIMEISR